MALYIDVLAREYWAVPSPDAGCYFLASKLIKKVFNQPSMCQCPEKGGRQKESNK